jgi:hypothetical protein
MEREQEFYGACSDGRLEEAKGILHQNPDFKVNWKNKDGSDWTGLHMACARGHSSIVSLLLAHPDIDVNSKSKWGSTPLSRACCGGRFSVIELLLKDRRVLINAPSDNGSTPLSVAAYGGHLEVIKAMIASGRELDLGQPGEVNRDAIGEAKLNGKTEVVSLLERFRDLPDQTRHELRKELGWHDVLAAEAFALVIFLCDDYFALAAHQEEPGSKTVRFFAIAQRLPMELQMILCNRSVGSSHNGIRLASTEIAFQCLGKSLLRAV